MRAHPRAPILSGSVIGSTAGLISPNARLAVSVGSIPTRTTNPLPADLALAVRRLSIVFDSRRGNHFPLQWTWWRGFEPC